jgi:hypothetical protein
MQWSCYGTGNTNKTRRKKFTASIDDLTGDCLQPYAGAVEKKKNFEEHRRTGTPERKKQPFVFSASKSPLLQHWKGQLSKLL